MTTMPLRHFEADRLLLPAPLADRAQRMRAAATRAHSCHCCAVTRHTLGLCFAAARYGDLEWAELLLIEAEHYVDHGTHATGCPHVPYAPCKRDRLCSQGQLAEWAALPGDLVAATDASWKKGAWGIGYVTSDGRWGARGRRSARPDPDGPSRVLVNELRAVAFLLDGLEADRPLLLLIDSLSALRLLRAWQNGDTTPVPAELPELAGLAQRVRDRPGLRAEHVKAHTGHPLNETADSLAKIARRRVTEKFDVVPRAEGLVRAFLIDWHDRADAHGLAA
ncbi:RNase H family protein [Spirillospora sp. CA-253888]